MPALAARRRQEQCWAPLCSWGSKSVLSSNHTITEVGKDLEDHRVQQLESGEEPSAAFLLPRCQQSSLRLQKPICNYLPE